MSNNSTFVECHNLHTTVLFRVSTYTIAFVSILALSANIIGWKLVACAGGAIPANVKYLIVNCHLNLAIKDVYFLCLSIYHVILISYQFGNPSNYILPIGKLPCTLFLYFYMIPSINVGMSLFAVGLERLYATLRKNIKDLDTVDNPIKLFCVIIWMIGTVHYFSSVIFHGSMFKPVCYCYITLIWPAISVSSTIYFATFIQSTCCLMYISIYFINKHYLIDFGLNTARHSLSQRFVVWSNIKTSMWLLPASFMHSITHISVFALVTVAMTGNLQANGSSTVEASTGYVNFVSAYMTWLAAETLIHPILCIKYNGFLLEKFSHHRLSHFIFLLCNRSSVNSKIAANSSVTFSGKIPNDLDDQAPIRLLADTITMPEDVSRRHLTASTKDSNVPLIRRSNDKVDNMVAAVAPVIKQNSGVGRKVIVEYRVAPDASQDILELMWNSARK